MTLMLCCSNVNTFPDLRTDDRNYKNKTEVVQKKKKIWRENIYSNELLQRCLTQTHSASWCGTSPQFRQAARWHKHHCKIWAGEVNNKILAALITVVKVPLCKALNPEVLQWAAQWSNSKKTGQLPGVYGCKCEYKTGRCGERACSLNK